MTLVHHSKIWLLMSEMGQFRPISIFRATPGLPPKATEIADIMG
jgi:hypothetical protein